MKMLLGTQFICSLGVEGAVGVLGDVLPSIRFKKVVNHLFAEDKGMNTKMDHQRETTTGEEEGESTRVYCR